NWQGTFSVVLSKSEGRISSSARTSPSSSQSSSAGSFGRDAAGPNDFVNTEGRLIGDKPVVAKANLVYRLPWTVIVAANLQHQTGRLWARQIRPSGLGFPSAPTINMEANTGDRRVADVNFVDLRVQKDVAIPRSAQDKAQPAEGKAAGKPIPKAYLWSGTGMFVGGMAVGLYAFIHNKNGQFPGQDEYYATNRTLGAVGLLTAFGGGAVLLLG